MNWRPVLVTLYRNALLAGQGQSPGLLDSPSNGREHYACSWSVLADIKLSFCQLALKKVFLLGKWYFKNKQKSIAELVCFHSLSSHETSKQPYLMPRGIKPMQSV